MAAILPALVVTEITIDYGKMWCRGCRRSLRVVLESTIIRLTNDLGRLIGNLSRARPWGLFERFDYFCDRAHVASERRVATAKLVASLAVVSSIGWLTGFR
jgi:hypothetical protein